MGRQVTSTMGQFSADITECVMGWGQVKWGQSATSPSVASDGEPSNISDGAIQRHRVFYRMGAKSC